MAMESLLQGKQKYEFSDSESFRTSGFKFRVPAALWGHDAVRGSQVLLFERRLGLMLAA